MTNDAQLLRRYIEFRSDTAFAEIVTRHLGMVYHSALRQVGGDAHLAEDIAQNVFLLLAKRAGTLCNHPTLAGWLHTTTHFKAREALRAEARRRVRERLSEAMNTTNERSAESDWNGLRSLIDEVLLELADRDREAVLLRFFEERSYGEIGSRLELTEQAARKRVQRALDKLRRRLARRGIESTGAALGSALASQPLTAAPAGLAATITSVATAAPIPVVSAFSLIPFMSSIKSTVAGAAVVVMIAAGVATYETAASHEAADAVAAAKRERDELAARLEEAESGDRRERESTDERIDGSNQTPSAAAKRPAQVSGLQDGSEFLRAHPEIRDALVEVYRSDILREFDELFAALEMSPEEIEAFIRIRMSGMRRILGRYELSVADPAPTGEEYRANLRSLLGDDGMQRLLEYERMQPARQLPVELARALYFTSTPLTADQGREIQRIAVEALSDPAGSEDVSKQWLYLPQEIWEPILAAAEDILSEQQFAALSDLYQKALFQRAYADARRAYDRRR